MSSVTGDTASASADSDLRRGRPPLSSTSPYEGMAAAAGEEEEEEEALLVCTVATSMRMANTG